LGQEYFINSQELESKVRTLLPSQGGAGAGFDLSASTQIIPIIDLTESAEGSSLRADLQTSISFGSSTAFNVVGATSTVISNTGYFRIFGTNTVETDSGGDRTCNHIINDGSSDKTVFQTYGGDVSSETVNGQFDYIILLEAGHTFKVTCSTASHSVGVTRQVANLAKELVNP
jgi:hypothetical protein